MFDESKAGVQAAEEILAAHYEKTCSWLSNHTILTKTAASKVGEFLCPPPVFFFEKGDICIDLWWGGLEGHHTVCRALPTYTQLIARRQRVPSISTDAPGPLAARPLTYEEIHRQEMKQFDEEIQTLKMKKQLARFAFYCYQTISRANNDEALELEFKINWWNRDKRCQIVMMGDTVDVEECVRYMDKTFFDEQLARYNLRLESFEFDYLHRFVFARIEN